MKTSEHSVVELETTDVETSESNESGTCRVQVVIALIMLVMSVIGQTVVPAIAAALSVALIAVFSNGVTLPPEE